MFTKEPFALKGKKVTLMGLGLLGRGIGDAAFLAENGADLIVTDLKTEAELAEALDQLKSFSNITYHLGGHRLEDFENRDFIIRANNTPLDSPFIAHARERGIPIEMDASLFARYSPAMIVGVTGTRGKSTVTHLIYQMIKAAGKSVFIGGNERGVATLALLDKATENDIVVLELDSWQLQGFAESNISPHISVWTNFMPDHMNYYKNDMERYFEDKAAIVRWQTSKDFFISTKEIKERIEATFGTLQATCILDSALPNYYAMPVPGEHNRKNAAFARAVAKCLNINEKIIKETLQNFKGLPGRLEYLGEKNGIAFYNDSNATTPEATIAALRALAEHGRPIILIAGGNDKQLNFSNLIPELQPNVKQVILFKGAATDKIQMILPTGFPAQFVANMKEAVIAATSVAAAGDIILLSPGATSFGIFKNEYDRGDQFTAAVKAL